MKAACAATDHHFAELLVRAGMRLGIVMYRTPGGRNQREIAGIPMFRRSACLYAPAFCLVCADISHRMGEFLQIK
jgi:hypothetical protein